MTRPAALFPLLLALSTALAKTPDFFSPRASLNADTRLYLDAWSGHANAVERLRARLNQAPAPANAYSGWSFLCAFEFHRTRYANAVRDCEKAIALNANGGDTNELTRAKLLAGQPETRAYGSAHLPVTDGAQISVIAGGYDGTAIADTGAQISVMMQSVAQAAHVRILGPSGEVGSSAGPVSGQIGLIPELRLAQAVLRNVPVLVLPDARLTFGDGSKSFSVHFGLSLYALADFGRIAWLDHDRWLALGSAAPAASPGAVPMIWYPTGIAIPLDGPGGRRAARLDTGSDASVVYDNGVSLLADADRAAMFSAELSFGAVGGVVKERVRRVPRATLTIAGQPLVFENLNIAKESSTGAAASLGDDLLRACSTVVLDFRAMTFSVSQ